MKIKVILSLLIGLNTLYLAADSLQNIVKDVLNTNPVVLERLENYKVIKSEIDIAKADYFPTIDLESAFGRKTTGRISGDVIDATYSVFRNSLILRQNIFNGFSTSENINYQTMRTLSASYSYLNTANDIVFKTVNAYLDVLQEKALLENSNLTIKHNDITYRKVQKAYKAGISTYSEVSKIQSSLALAKSNGVFQKHKLLNAQNKFKRLTGKNIDIQKLEKAPSLLKLPKTQKAAKAYALEYSPAVQMGNYNIKGAKAQYEKSKGNFYPTIDVELSQNYNDNYNEFIGTDDRSQGLVVMRYNLYKGGADEANKLKSLNKISQEIALSEDSKREIKLGVELAWDLYISAKEQIPFLEQYKAQSQKTLSLYNDEYHLGKRSLLDLISAENDLKRANDELIYAKNAILRSQYNLMHAMGLIIISIIGDESQYYKKVGISKHYHEKKQIENYTDISHALKTSTTKPSFVTKKQSKQHTQKQKENSSPVIKNIIDSFSKVRWKSR